MAICYGDGDNDDQGTNSQQFKSWQSTQLRRWAVTSVMVGLLVLRAAQRNKLGQPDRKLNKCHASGASLVPCWGHLGAILGPSWAILCHLGPFWGHLGPSWGHVGAI